jgi:parallel beta-helix repeat protein
LPNRTGVRITGQPGSSGRRATVTDFNAGVLINGGSGNTVENLNVRDNVSPGGDAVLGDGIVLFHSAKNQLINNLVSRNGPFDGIGVLGVDSNDNRIQGNTVEETVSSEGDFVYDGIGILINNFLDEQGTPRRGEPIRNNDVIDNVVRRNDNSGISNVTNIGARIMGNVVQDNGQRGGFCVIFGELQCQPVARPSNGIGFTAGPIAPEVTRALIQGNTVTGNWNSGIEIQTQENRIIGNTVLGNGTLAGPSIFSSHVDLADYNFDPPCDNNVYRANDFGTANLDCIYIQQGLESPLPPPPPSDGGPQ